MTKQYDNSNSGVLFKNNRKESDKQPDYNGSINVGGTDFWLAAWIKEGKSGKFMSLAVKPKESQESGPPPDKNRDKRVEDDEDLPF